MKTKMARYYVNRDIVNDKPKNIVKTIKAQCYVKGKSGKWIEYDDKADVIVIVVGNVSTVIENNDDTLVYYDASQGRLTICNDNQVTFIDI